MKTNVMTTGNALNKEDLKELMKETKETLAVDAKETEENPSFSLVDMWNVQKRQRTAAAMTRRWWLN
ncbi:MAG: hypothetical protein U0V75_13515 [Ferruginibacter sp.]